MNIKEAKNAIRVVERQKDIDIEFAIAKRDDAIRVYEEEVRAAVEKYDRKVDEILKDVEA